MYVADSESSTIRCVSLKDGSVKALVGGALDPLVCIIVVPPILVPPIIHNNISYLTVQHYS